MIAALIEGVLQAPLPCSWPILLPALAVGLGSPPARVLIGFLFALVLAVWALVAGWLAPPLGLAGVTLLAGAIASWWKGPGVVQAALLGAGAAGAWRPCVGPELGRALTTAQTEPLAAFPSLAAFLIGLAAVGLVIGFGVALLVHRRTPARVDRAGALLMGAIGLTIIFGIYPSVVSALARWSVALWA